MGRHAAYARTCLCVLSVALYKVEDDGDEVAARTHYMRAYRARRYLEDFEGYLEAVATEAAWAGKRVATCV